MKTIGGHNSFFQMKVGWRWTQRLASVTYTTPVLTEVLAAEEGVEGSELTHSRRSQHPYYWTILLSYR